MNLNRIIPTPPALAREALTVVGGAILAAAIIAAFPRLKAWIKDQWA